VTNAPAPLTVGQRVRTRVPFESPSWARERLDLPAGALGNVTEIQYAFGDPAHGVAAYGVLLDDSAVRLPVWIASADLGTVEDEEFAVVFDRPDTGPAPVWGPFRMQDAAERFARFVTEEIDPARVATWAEAVASSDARPSDPVAELLAWRDSVALPQIAAYRPA
jgi:hypothetical protein